MLVTLAYTFYLLHMYSYYFDLMMFLMFCAVLVLRAGTGSIKLLLRYARPKKSIKVSQDVGILTISKKEGNKVGMIV